MKKIKFISLFIFSVIVIIILFNTKYTSLLSDFENTSRSKAALINENIKISVNFIEGMTVVGNTYFKSDSFEYSELYDMLAYDAASDSYNLDAVSGTKYEKTSGSLTGLGQIPTGKEIKNELGLAFLYNEFFYNFYNRLDHVAWLYYTSENDFLNLFPWVSSKDYTYDVSAKDQVFYKFLTPETDPMREYRWSPVYMDQAGKGYMVTLSSPIYDGDVFKGVVSVDFTNEQLSEIIISKYDSYLTDAEDTVIATDKTMLDTASIYKLNELLDAPQSYIDKINNVKEDTVQRVGSNYVYIGSFSDAPWKLVVTVPVLQKIGKSSLFVLPVLLICVLLFFTLYESEKRKVTEKLLNESLAEIKSYQNFLENAAKYDFLTNTVNRRGLKDIFDKKMISAGLVKTPISFIIGDIDHFKLFNDTYGHAAGDKVLTEIALLMQKNIIHSDVVCRWGGEEFVIMLWKKTIDEAKLIAEDIRKKIENAVIPWEKSTKLRTTMTFGIAGYNYDESMEASITKADAALYLGKESGRNKVVCSCDS
jgi:diguanylate cyclase